MIDFIKLTFSIFCYVSSAALILFLFGLIFTYKFKNKHRWFYAIFLGISKREVIIHVTNFLNVLLLFYFLFNIKYFYTYGLIMIIVINIISCIVCLNVHIIVIDIVYTIISAFLFLMLRLVNNYLLDVVFDNTVNILRIVFMAMIGVYIIYIGIRKLEVTMRSYKGLRRT